MFPSCFDAFLLAYALTSFPLSKLCSFFFLLSSRISIFSSSTSSRCSSSSHTSSSSWNHNILSETVSLCACICACICACRNSRQSCWQFEGKEKALSRQLLLFDMTYVVKIGQGACVSACVSTWISGLVTSSTMLLASSLDSKATAFSLSCTSQPLICASKTSIDGHV